MRKTTDQTRAVLDVLADGGWHYGLEIVEKTGIDNGTVYPILFRLYDRQEVERQPEDPESCAGRAPRKYYRLNQPS